MLKIMVFFFKTENKMHIMRRKNYRLKHYIIAPLSPSEFLLQFDDVIFIALRFVKTTIS